ncbi:MAG: hypothetical protein L6V95_02720 [Candidatus Melainabacteria bacterium]|nr:MAG: hypothetical protein L6V95_02720 [Candidatus Melainabacteria bacterium]
MVENEPLEEEVIDDILNFIGDYTIVGHNVIFDFSFLNEASLRHKINRLSIIGLIHNFYTKKFFRMKNVLTLTICPRVLDFALKIVTEPWVTQKYLQKVYPKLKKLYEKKYDWQLKQLDNIEYLFERYLRVQQMITTCQVEIQDLKKHF